MKNKTTLLLNLLFCIGLLLSCSPRSALTMPTTTPTQTASLTPTLVPTSTETSTPVPPTETPVPTSARPLAPKNLAVSYVCQRDKYHNLVQITFNFTWEDKSNNATGFDIYKNSIFVKSIPADSTKYVDAVTMGVGNPSGGGNTYAIQAFNAAGKSNRVSISMRYQC